MAGRYSQPQVGPSSIDWSNPITQGLFDVWNFALPAASLVRESPVVLNGAVEAIGSCGQGLFSSPSAGVTPANLLANGSSLPTGPCTVVYVYDEISTGNRSHAIFSCPNPGATSAEFHAYIPYSDGKIYWRYGNGTGISATAGALKKGDVFVFTAGGVKGRQIWQNAKLLASDASTLTRASSSSPFTLGDTLASGSHEATSFALMIFSRQLSDPEIRSISSNPWQIFDAGSKDFLFRSDASALSASATGFSTASGSASLFAQVALAGVGVSVTGGAASGGVAVPLSAAGISLASGVAGGGVNVNVSSAGLAQAAGSAGLSIAVLLAAAGAAYASGNATLGAQLQAIANGGATASGVATLSGGAAGSISAAGLAQAAGSATLSASVYLAGVGAATAAGNATLAAQLNALASGAAQAGGTANLSGGAVGSISASGSSVASGSATLKVNIALVAAGSAQAGGSATLSGGSGGAIAAAGGAQSSGAAITSVSVSLTAAGFVHAMGSGQLTIYVSGGLLQPGPDKFRVDAHPLQHTINARASHRRVNA